MSGFGNKAWDSGRMGGMNNSGGGMFGNNMNQQPSMGGMMNNQSNMGNMGGMMNMGSGGITYPLR